MVRGARALIGGAAAVALTACGGSGGKLEIRAIPAALAPAGAPVSARIAEARGQFALGNVGLALEGFRKALREEPGSIAALDGIALCYDLMGRFDLSRRHYEMALAIAPDDAGIYAHLAASLDLQGKAEEARSLRAEMAQRFAAPAKPAEPPRQAAGHDLAAAQPAAKAEVPALAEAVIAPALAEAVPDPALVMAAVPPNPVARPAPTRPRARAQALAPAPSRIPVTAPTAIAAAGPSVTVTLPPPRAGAEREPVAKAIIDRPTQPMVQPAVPPVAIASGPAPGEAPRPVAPSGQKPLAQIAARSVTVTLPAPRPVASAPQALALAETPLAPAKAAPAPRSVEEAPTAPATPSVAMGRPVDLAPAASAVTVALPPARQVVEAAPPAGPRLERMSLGEVALVTARAPLWKPRLAERTPPAARIVEDRVRFAGANTIVLLNAARHAGLAARTRHYLAALGWRRIGIGDASRTQPTSVILYPASRAAQAARLARQFGFRMSRQVSTDSQVTVLLGRDAAADRLLRAIRA